MKHLAYIILCFVMLCNVHLVNAQGDVKIGKQTWMSKNLDVSTFRNGEAIPEAKSKEEWSKAGENQTAAFCYYEFDPKNGEIYGKLYNWFAVNDSRGLAPSGYHVPSEVEWNNLIFKFLGNREAGKKMKSKSGWAKMNPKSGWAKIYGKNGNGDNSSGFNGLPGGNCDHSGGFLFITIGGHFWSSTEFLTDFALYKVLGNSTPDVGNYHAGKKYGMSVRCLKD